MDLGSGEPTDWPAMVEALYRTQFDAMCRAARRLVDTQHASEEVVQEAFVRFAMLTVRPRPGRELSYLRSIVLNEARSTLRRRVVARRYWYVSVDVAADDETADAAVRSDDARTLHRCLGDLPLRQRQVFTLRHLAGFSERETAIALSISPGSVKTHNSRAMSSIRERLASVA
ncbi:putative RNA polymerase ECF subfamily sigma factor [Ilumatobacter coccineus YM16-304]|uniref:Putative RNA polymerase ECF subfamily sigma factor n=2 Tax=Ilumatobacter coccineus TaxID=467094 RepID=A0A6C7E2K8_ILUCY|nr:putative RNA polymerase ECF subfamily sigma factor [Ilumatobacter coccineus YM16-304]